MTNDAGFALAYAIIMLNTDQHNHNVRKQNIPMTVEVSGGPTHLNLLNQSEVRRCWRVSSVVPKDSEHHFLSSVHQL